MTNILELDSVILEFGSKRVLQDVYLKCETGKISGLLGKNGTGKSCLMKIIYGELQPNYKSLRVNGITLIDGCYNPRDIRFLPQFTFIPKFLTIKNIFNDFDLDFVNFTAAFPEFETFYDKKLKELSGGDKRIIEIYSILVSKAKFCMLDEPFTQVAPIHVETIKNIIIKEKKNKGILLTDHLYKNIIDICDNLYVLNNGKSYLTKSIQDLETLGYAKISMSKDSEFDA
jgi:ABC-type multidrug transport system ATPase subunit